MACTDPNRECETLFPQQKMFLNLLGNINFLLSGKQILFPHNVSQGGQTGKYSRKSKVPATIHYHNSFQDLELKESESEDERPAQMFSKMRKLTQQKLNVSRYEVLSASVNEFAGKNIV